MEHVPLASLEAHYPALVLNADFRPLSYLPLSTWSWEDAVHAVVQDRVSVIMEYDRLVRSPSVTLRSPSVVALREHVRRREIPSITRTNLISLRDHCSCAYCGKTFPMVELTFDHVVPRAQGGRTRWENIVSACGTCNSRKEDRTPSQAGMPLLWRPHVPSIEELARRDFFVHQRRVIEDWKAFLPYAA